MEFSNMNKLNRITFLALFLFMVSCNDSATETNPIELLNGVWVLKSFEVNGIQDIPPADQVYNIQFKADNKFSGINDCNTISGNYGLNSNNITIDNISSTEVYCGKESLDYRYLEALSGAETYKIEKNKLSIYYQTNSRLIFIGE